MMYINRTCPYANLDTKIWIHKKNIAKSCKNTYDPVVCPRGGMVDAADLKSADLFDRGGSSPSAGTPRFMRKKKDVD